MRVLALVVLLGATATASADKLCEDVWPRTAKPAKKDTEKCIAFWFDRYGMSGQDYEACDDDLVAKYTTVELAHVAELIGAYKGKACKDVETEVKTLNSCARTVEYLDCATQRFFTVGDEPLKGREAELVAVYGKLLAGKAVTEAEIGDVSDGTLLKLRNAPYARHGRPFKNPDLQRFFYGAKPADGDTLPLPLVPNAAYTDAMLDKIDERNVGVVLKLIKAREAERAKK